MALPSAQAVAAKWAQRAGAAAQDYVAGAQATDKDPTALAIANGQRYISQVQARYNDGTWANQLRKSGKAGWLAGITGKGVSNYSSGVSNSQDKVAQAFAGLLAYEEAGLRTVQAMPNVTDADREARALAWIRYMRNYQAP